MSFGVEIMKSTSSFFLIDTLPCCIVGEIIGGQRPDGNDLGEFTQSDLFPLSLGQECLTYDLTSTRLGGS